MVTRYSLSYSALCKRERSRKRHWRNWMNLFREFLQRPAHEFIYSPRY
jgi:hypothetical protein